MAYLLHQLLRASAERQPESTAVVGEDSALTYAQLDALADAATTVLMELGTRPGDRVAMFGPKSPRALATMYGVMRAGAAYVPIDPLAPPARAAHIIRDSGARAVVTTADLHAQLAEVLDPVPPALLVTAEPVAGAVAWGEVERATTKPAREGLETDLAYVLYTSGSTGLPKGVMITHRNSLTFVDWCQAKFAPRPDDRFVSHAPFHFDLSIHDLYVAASAGAAVHLLAAEEAYFPAAVDAFIREHRITVWYSVPSALVRLTQYLQGRQRENPYPDLRLVHFAGEVYPVNELRQLCRLVPGARLFNLYGPTETNVCTYYEVGADGLDSVATIPIGRACENFDTFAVTPDGRIAAVGEEGELWVRGPGVMVGYLNLEEETAARLVPNPFAPHLNERAYRTGDIVVPTAGGDFEFHGRRDHQIKLRGYRIELGEIEAVLAAHLAVAEAAVILAGEPAKLVGFARIKGDVEAATLASWCRGKLPSYMVPDEINLVDSLPMTSTGKIDRRALSAASG